MIRTTYSYSIILSLCIITTGVICNVASSSDVTNRNISPAVRWKRQVTACSGRFKCQSGQCIDYNKVCNGFPDCQDSTDETRDLCQPWNRKCPPRSFQCSYGACINDDGICNGITDCLDESDEKVAGCSTVLKNPEGCLPEEFSCSSGQCLGKALLCDGKRDCNDGSDETDKKCESKITKPFVAPIGTSSCTLPRKPENGDLTVSGCAENDFSPACKRVEGAAVATSTVITFNCFAGFKIKGEQQSICFNGKWLPSVSTSCEAVCGINHGQSDRFPWHVAVYKRNSQEKYDQICDGVLISDTLVVTAAHCFWDWKSNGLLRKDNFRFAVGKQNRNFYVTERQAQIRTSQEIKIPEHFQGQTLNYANDIALVRFSDPTNLSRSVTPACIDWNNHYENVQLVNGNVGSVPVYSFTEDGKPNQILQRSQLSFVNFENCWNALEESLRAYISRDKFCAKYSNGASICAGDSGAGLVFETDGVWYLRGIISTGLSTTTPGSSCMKDLTGFTQVSRFLDFLKS